MKRNLNKLINKFKLPHEIMSGKEIRKLACRKCRDTENKLKKQNFPFLSYNFS